MQWSVFNHFPQRYFEPKESGCFLLCFQFSKKLYEQGRANFPQQGVELHQLIEQSYMAINKTMFLHLRMYNLIDNI